MNVILSSRKKKKKKTCTILIRFFSIDLPTQWKFHGFINHVQIMSYAVNKMKVLQSQADMFRLWSSAAGMGVSLLLKCV